MATRSARALWNLSAAGRTTREIITADSVHNAMAVHAACGGSTNLLLHVPAIAFAAGVERPTVDGWSEINRRVPRFVDVLPNGPKNHPTVRVFLAGGVPEIMLHLRDLDLLRLDAATVSGKPLGDVLDWWEHSERRQRVRAVLREREGIDPDEVILPPAEARKRGFTSTVCFPKGNLAPQGSVIKATAIDPSVVGDDGIYRMTGPARVFTSERAAIAAIKGQSEPPLKAGDVLVLIGRGPLGSGMEETYQITSALKFLPWGKQVAVLTDARFSGVSTGACVGHIGPEALAGGPIGKLQDGDLVRITIDRNELSGSIDFIGEPDQELSPTDAAHILDERSQYEGLAPDERLPPETRLWAALQSVGGGTWSGCVYDVDAIIERLNAVV